MTGYDSNQLSDGKMYKRDHARFLVGLMSPFASRAGTQGITSASSINANQRPRKVSREAQKTAEYVVTKLSPIAKNMLQESQKQQTFNKTIQSESIEKKIGVLEEDQSAQVIRKGPSLKLAFTEYNEQKQR